MSFRIFAAALLCLPAFPSRAASWESSPEAAFARAKKEHRLVLLDLQAVWCHWCHVMDRTTYADASVQKILDASYVAARVDQDSRPDLAARYADYGWPATVLYDENGRELAKLRGYLPPDAMAARLRAFADDPTPGPSVQEDEAPEIPDAPRLAEPLRAALVKDFHDTYDRTNGSWGFNNKYLEWTSVEYALALSENGDAGARRMAERTLDAQRALFDPVWGGVYQYSTGGNWKEPHFEKIMAMQAGNLRVYALAYAHDHDPSRLESARRIADYLKSFLTSPDGLFYASQDADLVPGRHAGDYFALGDAARRERGVPRVDTHAYSRENGWAISALTALYAAGGDEDALDAATSAAAGILSRRGLPGGGFRHGDDDAGGPYLGDTLAMGRAFLDLYAATGGRAWLTHAREAASFLRANFGRAGGAGFDAASVSSAAAFGSLPDRDENVAVARFGALLFEYTGDPADRAMAESAFRYLAAPQVALKFPAAGALLAERELAARPLHLTVVGSRKDARTRALFAAAVAYPAEFKRVELWDPAEGPLPRGDVSYPPAGTPAAYVCAERSCSSPLRDPARLAARVDAMRR